MPVHGRVLAAMALIAGDRMRRWIEEFGSAIGNLAVLGLSDLVVEAENALGCDVVTVEAVPQGYTAQPVLRLRLGDGRGTSILKAAPPAVIDARLDWHAELEREIKLYDSHPELDAWRPQFHGALDASGWRGLLMEDLGQSFRPPPWTDAMTHRVAIGLARMHGETRRGGDCVIHGDVRSDNLFLVRDRGLMLCDWAEARWGSPVEDAAYWAVGVECEGGELASDAYARYVAAAEELQASTLVPILRQLALLNQRRVERLSEPDRVRRLRQHELAAMRNWLSSEGGDDANGVWTGSQQPPTTICSTKPTLASGENQDQVGPVSGEKSDQHSPG